MSKNTRVNILGVEIDAITIDEAINRILSRSEKPGSCFVVKPYVEFFTGKHNRTLNKAWLSLPDGVALQWAAYFKTTSGSLWQLIKTLAQIIVRPEAIRSVVPEKFAGINFTWPLLEAAQERGKTVFLVGSPQGNTINQTAAAIQQQLPDLQIVGTLPGRGSSGVFSRALEETLITKLKSTSPDIVLIGIGFPRQEELMVRLVPQLKKGVLIGEGGTFDYQKFGGQNKKAPEFIQTIGLEWAWRLLLQPSRIKRQLAIPRFIIRTYRDHRV